MAVEHAPPRDAFALSGDERTVRDTVRDWAQREVAPGAARRDEDERYDRSLFERAGELGLNHPMGPLELSDFIGNDVMLGVMDVLYRGFGDPKFRAAPLLRQMVAAGHLGRKTGRGFYRYDEQGNRVG